MTYAVKTTKRTAHIAGLPTICSSLQRNGSKMSVVLTTENLGEALDQAGKIKGRKVCTVCLKEAQDQVLGAGPAAALDAIDAALQANTATVVNPTDDEQVDEVDQETQRLTELTEAVRVAARVATAAAPAPAPAATVATAEAPAKVKAATWTRVSKASWLVTYAGKEFQAVKDGKVWKLMQGEEVKLTNCGTALRGCWEIVSEWLDENIARRS